MNEAATSIKGPEGESQWVTEGLEIVNGMPNEIAPAKGTPAGASFAAAGSATAVSSFRTFEELHFVFNPRQRSKWPKTWRLHVTSLLGTQSDKERSEQEMNANHAYET